MDSGHSVEKLYNKYWKPFETKDKFWREEVKRGRLNRPRIDRYFPNIHNFMKLSRMSANPMLIYKDLIPS